MVQHDWQKGRIVRIEDETASTKRFWIELPEVARFDFEPGQFITLELPIHEQQSKRARSYSIASAPNGTNVVELVIVQLDGGLGTGYLFNEATVGTEFPVKGPRGHFTLTDPIETDIFMVCTGTGIAPFRSMIHHIYNNNIPHKELYLIYGTRKNADALYLEEFSELKDKLPSLHYIPTFSRETEVAPGHGIGYVHDIYEQLLDGKDTSAHFYLCGWRDMINEARKRLTERGFDKKSIHFELYG